MSDEAHDPVASEPTVDELVAAARRKYGRGGAGLAAGMLGLEIALGNKKKPESVQVQEAPTEPVDIDKDGFEVAIDAATTVVTAPLERRAPLTTRKRRQRR